MKVELHFNPNCPSELYEWKIIQHKKTIGYLQIGNWGMAVNWIAFADGYEWPKVNNIQSATKALQEYFDWRWNRGSLNYPVQVM